jgi:hypothetical protein
MCDVFNLLLKTKVHRLTTQTQAGLGEEDDLYCNFLRWATRLRSQEMNLGCDNLRAVRINCM